MKRRRPNLKEQVCILAMHCKDEDGRYLIDREWAKDKTLQAIAAELWRTIEWDHIVALGLGGTNHVTNFQPLKVAPHRSKTKLDVSAIYKADRLTEAQEEHRRKMLAKTPAPKSNETPSATKSSRGKKKWPSRKIPSRPFPKATTQTA
jgi:hypothetical protein